MGMGPPHGQQRRPRDLGSLSCFSGQRSWGLELRERKGRACQGCRAGLGQPITHWAGLGRRVSYWSPLYLLTVLIPSELLSRQQNEQAVVRAVNVGPWLTCRGDREGHGLLGGLQAPPPPHDTRQASWLPHSTPLQHSPHTAFFFSTRRAPPLAHPGKCALLPLTKLLLHLLPSLHAC